MGIISKVKLPKPNQPEVTNKPEVLVINKPPDHQEVITEPEIDIIAADHSPPATSSVAAAVVVDDDHLDAKWERFMPSDYKQIISRSAVDSSSLDSMSKKDLYFHLHDHPLIINNGTMSFGIDKQTGKICYMIAASGLSIVWGPDPRYWQWISLPDSRFSNVAKLKQVWWLDIKGRIKTEILSSKTTYGAYFVFKLAEERQGFQEEPIELELFFEGELVHENRMSLFLDPPQGKPQIYRARGDGWMEIEMGEFFIEDGKNFNVICRLKGADDYNSKCGLIVEGIEFRSKGAVFRN